MLLGVGQTIMIDRMWITDRNVDSSRTQVREDFLKVAACEWNPESQLGF